MWLTGNDAVNRFDGHTVKVYNLNKYFKDCQPLQQGYGFAEDSSGNIYIGSVRGLYVWTRKKDQFTLHKIFTTKGDDLAIPIGYADGKIWCFNKEYSIAAFNISTKIIEHYTQLPIPPIKSIHVYNEERGFSYFKFPFIDSNNIMRFIGEREIYSYDFGGNLLSKNSSPVDNMYFLSSSYYREKDCLFIGTNKGVLSYYLSTGKVKHNTLVENTTLAEVRIIAAGNSGITLLNSQTGDVEFTDFTFSKKLTLLSSKKTYIRTYAFYFDKKDRIWTCDDGLGQLIIDFSNALLKKPTTESLLLEKLIKNGVSSFAEFPDESILIQTFALLTKDKKLTEFFGINTYTRLETDSFRKGIWAVKVDDSNIGHKFSFIDERKKIINLKINANGIKPGNFHHLKVLDKEKILCSFNTGLYWFYPDKKRMELITAQPYTNSFTLSPLSGNRVAVSYLNNDMQIVSHNKENEKLIFETKVLPGIQSFYMQEDTLRGIYWVGTNQGVYKLDKNFKAIGHYDANDGLAGTNIYGLLLDSEGNCWCSHQRGISSINQANSNIINYDKTDGIQDWDYNNRAFYKASDGTLYFGGVSGFNYFKPPLIINNVYSPEVYIDEIKINNSTWWPDTNANLINHIKLPSEQNNLTFHIRLKDLGQSGAQIIYKIKGDGSNWKKLSVKEPLSFNSLAPGTYILELGYYDKFSNKYISQKEITIIIASPFYRKAWFWMLVAAAATAVLFGYNNRRRIHQQKNKFEKELLLEQQRQKITADLHDEIGSSLSSLQINSAVAGQLMDKNPNQAKEVIKNVEKQSRKISEKIGDFIWSMKPGKDEFMTLSSRIKTFASDILGATSINYTIAIDPATDTTITDFTTRKNIILIVKEAINNAVKYSTATKVSITISINNSTLHIEVKDNGIGITDNQPTGNGLANMKKRTEELSGSFTIQTELQKGTTIVATIPVP